MVHNLNKEKASHASASAHRVMTEQKHGMSYYLGTMSEPMGEGAYLSSEAVMAKTTDKNMHCEDAGENAEKWHDCYEHGGDYVDGYKGAPPAKSGCFFKNALIATWMA